MTKAMTKQKKQPEAKQAAMPSSGTLNVVGLGEIHVRPDVAWVNLGVTTRGATAEQATSANNEKMAEVIGRIRALGLPAESLQTGGAVLFPILHQEEGPQKGQIIGYGAENHVTVQTAVEQAGKVFDEGIGAGANQSSSVSFGLRDEAPMRKLALDVAVRSAYGEAQLVAMAAGVRLQGPRSMDIARGGGAIVQGRTSERSDASTPILPGKLTISAQVRVLYDYQYTGK